MKLITFDSIFIFFVMAIIHWIKQVLLESINKNYVPNCSVINAVIKLCRYHEKIN